MIKKPPIFRDVTPKMYWYLTIKYQDTKYADYWLMKLPKQFLKWGYSWRFEHILMDFLALLSAGRSRINVETEPMTFCCGKGVAVVVLLQNILGLGDGVTKTVWRWCGKNLFRRWYSKIFWQFGDKNNLGSKVSQIFWWSWQKLLRSGGKEILRVGYQIFGGYGDKYFWGGMGTWSGMFYTIHWMRGVENLVNVLAVLWLLAVICVIVYHWHDFIKVILPHHETVYRSTSIPKVSFKSCSRIKL